jgi:hypothetical protein
VAEFDELRRQSWKRVHDLNDFFEAGKLGATIGLGHAYTNRRAISEVYNHAASN